MNRTRRNWTTKEDDLLRELVQQELDNGRPLLWRQLAKHIPDRSNKDCRKRWWNSLAGGTVKGAWSPEEDQRLADAVAKYSTNWTQVAAAVGSRCGDQCSSHWRQVLDPNINCCDWTAEEDKRLLSAVVAHGTNWSIIASFHTPQRATLALKNRYWKLRQRNNRSKSPSTQSSGPQKQTSSVSGVERDSMTKTADTICVKEDDVSEEEESDEDGSANANANANGNHQALHNGEMRDHGPEKVDLPRTCPMWTEEDGSHRAPSSTAGPVGPPGPAGPHGPPGPSTASGGPEESWIESITDQIMCGNATPIYSDDSLIYTTCHPAAGECSSMSLMQQADGDMMHVQPDSLDGFLDLKSDMFKQYSPLMSSASMPAMPTPTTLSPTVNAINADLMNENLIPMLMGGTADDHSHDETLHRVSINLSCTTVQLGKLMPLIASSGLVVNLKIDTE